MMEEATSQSMRRLYSTRVCNINHYIMGHDMIHAQRSFALQRNSCVLSTYDSCISRDRCVREPHKSNLGPQLEIPSRLLYLSLLFQVDTRKINMWPIRS